MCRHEQHGWQTHKHQRRFWVSLRRKRGIRHWKLQERWSLLFIMAENWAELCSTVGWEAEHVRCESGYLFEEIYKVVEVKPDFSLFLPVKCKRKKIRDKEKLKIKIKGKKMLNRKEQVLDNWGISWSIQVAKDANIRKFTVRKVCFGEKAKCMPGQPFAEVSLCMTR